MISEKAMKKLPLLYRIIKPDKIEAMATIISAGNVIIEDITRKGELVLKHLNKG